MFLVLIIKSKAIGGRSGADPHLTAIGPPLFNIYNILYTTCLITVQPRRHHSNVANVNVYSDIERLFIPIS